MIEKPDYNSPKTWQQQLANAFSNIDQLCHYLQLNPAELSISNAATKQFSLRVPLSFAQNMQKGNPKDPLLAQVLPVSEELHYVPGFIDDPVGDLLAATSQGLIHKYQGRVLLINTGSCAINCRYCFRRNFPYADYQLSSQKTETAITAIKQDTSINEVILSGGDPLILNNEKLSYLFNQLNSISHLKRIRIHTRLPVVLPARLDTDFLKILANSSQQVIIVIHSNHSNELSTEVIEACKLIKRTGCSLFNQSVLLKGVNDHADTLCQLSESLFAIGVTPYYLHLLDKAAGTSHFEVLEHQAVNLVRQMQKQLPGYMVPKLVKEVAGGSAKQSIAID